MAAYCSWFSFRQAILVVSKLVIEQSMAAYYSWFSFIWAIDKKLKTIIKEIMEASIEASIELYYN